VKIDLDELERLAKAASPGHWIEDDGNIFSKPLSDERERRINAMILDRSLPHPDDDKGLDGYPLGFIAKVPQFTVNFEGDINYIAALDPLTVLELIRLARGQK